MATFKQRIYALSFLRFWREHRSLALAESVSFSEGFSLHTFAHAFLPEWEREERAAMARLLPAHDVLIDVGANHGFYAVMADAT